MTTLAGSEAQAGGAMRPGGSTTASSILIRLILIGLIDAFALWFILQLVATGSGILAAALAAIILAANVIVIRNETYPLRWMLIGLILMALFAVYPIVYTVYVAFTNYGDAHLLSKQRAIAEIQEERYLPEGGRSFSWTAFRSPVGDFALWLQDSAGNSFLAQPGQPIVAGAAAAAGELDEDGIPLRIEGYERIGRLQTLPFLGQLGEQSFGSDDFTVLVRTIDDAAELEPLYAYDPAADVLTNQQTGVVYAPVEGTFTSPAGDALIPGFRAAVGVENFVRFFSSPALRGPLLRIISWNFAFAFLSVALTFALGLAIALLYNDPALRGRKLIRSLLLIPYTIPSLITILIWRGMMNPELGVISRSMQDLVGWTPPWFTDPWWAKAAILLVNLWLGYPYFMLVTSGALQAIPSDIYEAAEVDGANIWQRFRRITLPLLLVAVGPLLVASFVFNFNNFNLIFLFIQGGPPIAGASTRAGHTDILISYVYNLAFAGGRGADYGLASAITIVIFFVVAAITLFQFRYTRMWEEVSENV
ncbi:MAG: maltose ABC transporter permease MalF [Candidatus Promineifilaceae bacterium]